MSDLIKLLRRPFTSTPTSSMNLMSDAADQLEAQQAEIARLRELLGKVFRKLDTTQSPGHHHSVAGVWDDYNGDLSGKPCEWCATWSDVRQEVEQKP